MNIKRVYQIYKAEGSGSAHSTTQEASCGATRAITTLEGAARKSDSLPQAITVDNGPEFTGKTLDAWAYVNGIQIDFTRPGKPTDKMDISNRSTASCTMNSSRPPHL